MKAIFKISNTSKPPKRLGWAIHAIVWFVLFFLPFLFRGMYLGALGLQASLRFLVVLSGALAVFYANYSYLVTRYLFTRHIWQYLLSNLLLFAVINVASHLLMEVMHSCEITHPKHNHSPREIHFYLILFDFVKYIFLVAMSVAIKVTSSWYQVDAERKELEKRHSEAELQNLKSQLNPHFLFNSLNTLNALIKIDADKAQQYVHQLSQVFRYTLQNNNVISLEEELKFTQAYCHLMQIRYGDSLRFEFQIDPRYHSYSIIPSSLQTLVENAIKHNVVSSRQPLTISVATTANDTIRVSNPIQPKRELEKGEGIGLVNLSERYRLMWQRDIVINQDNGTFSVEINLVSS
jgi:sensor histidine kinase YesM